jgi:tRNA-dihydrouridine synthase
MWSLMFFLYLNGAVGMTHIDNFVSRKLCEQAAQHAILHARNLGEQYTRNIDIQYTCVLEIN